MGTMIRFWIAKTIAELAIFAAFVGLLVIIVFAGTLWGWIQDKRNSRSSK